jgi:hypothetical protein
MCELFPGQMVMTPWVPCLASVGGLRRRLSRPRFIQVDTDGPIFQLPQHCWRNVVSMRVTSSPSFTRWIQRVVQTRRDIPRCSGYRSSQDVMPGTYVPELSWTILGKCHRNVEEASSGSTKAEMDRNGRSTPRRVKRRMGVDGVLGLTGSTTKARQKPATETP